MAPPCRMIPNKKNQILQPTFQDIGQQILANRSRSSCHFKAKFENFRDKIPTGWAQNFRFSATKFPPAGHFFPGFSRQKSARGSKFRGWVFLRSALARAGYPRATPIFPQIFRGKNPGFRAKKSGISGKKIRDLGRKNPGFGVKKSGILGAKFENLASTIWCFCYLIWNLRGGNSRRRLPNFPAPVAKFH